MIIQCTAEAEMVSTDALYGGDDLVEFTLLYTTIDSIFTVRRRAPLEVLFVIDISSC